MGQHHSVGMPRLDGRPETVSNGMYRLGTPVCRRFAQPSRGGMEGSEPHFLTSNSLNKDRGMAGYAGIKSRQTVKRLG